MTPFLNVWYNSPVKACGPGVLFGGTTNLISLMNIVLFRLSIFS